MMNKSIVPTSIFLVLMMISGTLVGCKSADEQPKPVLYQEDQLIPKPSEVYAIKMLGLPFQEYDAVWVHDRSRIEQVIKPLYGQDRKMWEEEYRMGNIQYIPTELVIYVGDPNHPKLIRRKIYASGWKRLYGDEFSKTMDSFMPDVFKRGVWVAPPKSTKHLVPSYPRASPMSSPSPSVK